MKQNRKSLLNCMSAQRGGLRSALVQVEDSLLFQYFDCSLLSCDSWWYDRCRYWSRMGWSIGCTTLSSNRHTLFSVWTLYFLDRIDMHLDMPHQWLTIRLRIGLASKVVNRMAGQLYSSNALWILVIQWMSRSKLVFDRWSSWSEAKYWV